VTSPPETDAPRKTPTARPSTPQASGLYAVGSAPNLSRSAHTPAISAVQDRAKRDTVFEISARPTKRTKVEEIANAPKVPSLLSRLGNSLSRQSSRSDLSLQTQTSSPLSEVEPSQTNQGFSIKGAAKQVKQTSLDTGAASSSLLERLQDSRRDTGVRQHDVGRKKRNV
jgi:hypothetical protein